MLSDSVSKKLIFNCIIVSFSCKFLLWWISVTTELKIKIGFKF